MKNEPSNPALNQGSPSPGGDAVPASQPPVPPAQAAAAPAALPTGHYDAGHAYGTIQYAVGDPVPRPANEGARVKLGLQKKSNPDMLLFVQNHIDLITPLPLYADVRPLPADFLGVFNAYRSAEQALVAAESALRDAFALRDQMRAQMDTMMVARGASVQEISNGNRQAILSTGLQVRNGPTPVQAIAAPGNLRVDLNGEAGMMKIRWDLVPHALNYVLQCSPNVTPRVWEQLASTTKTQATKTLPVGEVYVFRVAAVGTPGQSNWSPEVIRGAA